jgi:hypothetical protein
MQTGVPLARAIHKVRRRRVLRVGVLSLRCVAAYVVCVCVLNEENVSVLAALPGRVPVFASPVVVVSVLVVFVRVLGRPAVDGAPAA